ncbi:MAG: aldehyde ferredoxin oxidoreductase family protein [Thermoleophilia bacterium]|nr:aldehyde ferredoxin oxidoreductase family protein [Thermoleophilia bacterium]
MGFGAMEKILWVDLSSKEMREERLDEKMAREYLGGYGLGARILFDKQRPGVDPLGPEATLGFVTGIMTGTDGVGGSRYTVVGKSPLTGGWGDANSGGEFGPYLKFAGYDAVFFTGISETPVYLHVDNGKAELRDAASIWGKDTFETEDILRQEHGKDLQVACIGPAGEKVALIASVMNNKGRAAGRSGLGAVMGSKRLKAVAVQGSLEVPLAEPALMKELRKKHVAALGGHKDGLHEFGTPGIYGMCCSIDDAPSKNWAGVASIDTPNYEDCGGPPVLEKQKRRYGCWRCPIACGGIMKAGTGEYTFEEGAHKPEYETLGMFGSNLANDNLDSIIVASDICNRLGMDTISAGACMAFTIECCENGILTKEDTNGLEMTWGDHKSIVALTEMLGRREGFGDVLADGVKIAAERIGKGSERYAMHIGGQEIPAHDPRGGWGFATGYGADPTPGRHNQGGGQHPPGLIEEVDRAERKGRGLYHKTSTNYMHMASALGLCQFVIGSYPHVDQLIEALKAITGWEDLTTEELLETGERVTNVRQAFNMREGMVTPFQYPDRMRGVPPKTQGPRAGITFTHDEIYNEYLELMDWDTKTGMPSKAKLLDLGLDDIAEVLYP